MVGLVNGEYEARKDSMAKYLTHVQSLKSAFQVFRVLKVPRAKNAIANQLSKLATSMELKKNQTVLVDYLERPIIAEMDVIDIDVPQEPNWMTLLIIWLRDAILPKDPEEVRKLVYRSNRYQFREGILYKRSFSFPWLRCLDPSEANYALREIHEGVCRNHTGDRTLSNKFLREGYFWPSMHHDAINFVRKCDKCQRNVNISRRPSEPLTFIMAPWPFAQ
ncbi:RVT_3 domain-containing protein [Cephalotus follicularis]|uniref:RVT_3 domain-containing protein n=1 Tax=Cephalotus follicularis TaxID=3775 RepID=A0A1Q3BQ61_CEPFO|nr:RVT_3 domain-containing protein [Cephalotus follicularis]